MFFDPALRLARRARARLGDERGFLSIMAVSILSAMMLAGLALMALNQRNNTALRNDRSTQTAYSIAEETLNDQLQALSRGWPSSSASAMPVECTQANANTGCPDPATVAATFSTTLAAQNVVEWKVMVRDNVGALKDDFQLASMNLGSTTGCAAPCTWDAGGNANGTPDSTLWVVAQAFIKTAGCASSGATGPSGNLSGCVRKRTLLAQAKLVESSVEVPRSVVTAGKFSTTNKGNKVIVDENGCWNVPGQCPPGGLSGVGGAAPIQVRCDSPNPGSANDPCLGYSSNKGQISPNLVSDNYPDAQLITPDELEMLRSSARSAGTYFTTCPPSAAGKVVFIELAVFATCSFSNETANSHAEPGALIIANGKLELGANMIYNGLIYAANNVAPFDAPDVVHLSGNAIVQGAIMIEGDGGVLIGQSSGQQPTINFDEAALNSFRGVTGVGIGQNTFRDLPTTG
ncbi:MAG: hypothetical protein ACSLFF_11235 [Solirubrobacterales bacterium]